MSRRGAEQMEAGFDCSVDLWPQGEKVPKGLRKANTLLCRYTYIQTLFYTHTPFSILQESLAAYCVEVRVTTSWFHFDVEKGRMQLSQSIIGWLQQLNVIIWIMDQVVWRWRLVTCNRKNRFISSVVFSLKGLIGTSGIFLLVDFLAWSKKFKQICKIKGAVVGEIKLLVLSTYQAPMTLDHPFPAF